MNDDTEKKTNQIVLFKTPSWEILGTAFIMMLIAKCSGYVPDLSWWIVTCPLWGPWAITVAFFIAFYVIAFIGLGTAMVFGLIAAMVSMIFDFFKSIFTQNKDDNDEYRLHG